MTGRQKVLIGGGLLAGALALWLWKRKKGGGATSGLSWLAPVSARVSQIRGRLALNNVPYVPIPFAYDESIIPDASKPDLDAIAAYLMDNPTVTVEVQGHTDSVGSDAYNWDLSAARAQSVWRYLVDRGVGPNRMFPVAKGEAEPIADNTTAEGRAANRRVEFVVI